MLAGESEPVCDLLGGEQLLLLGDRYGDPLALTEQPVDLIGHERRLITSRRIEVQSLHRINDSTNLSYLLIGSLADWGSRVADCRLCSRWEEHPLGLRSRLFGHLGFSR